MNKNGLICNMCGQIYHTFLLIFEFHLTLNLKKMFYPISHLTVCDLSELVNSIHDKVSSTGGGRT